MHYKNGREAHDGDPVIGESYKGSGVTLIGKLHSLQPATNSCNAQVAYVIPGTCANTCVTVGEFYHADDARLAIEAANKPASEPAS